MRDAEVDPAFEALLEYLREARHFDFTAYKRSTLVRRVEKRMHQVGIDGFVAYTDYLQVHPEEFRELFNTILINVTSYFRDPEAWAYLAAEIVPRVLAAKKDADDDSIRAWCAGSASGEEAYTLAMVLAEAIGIDEFRRRVKIYATDVDEEALASARPGGTTERDLGSVPPELAGKYFDQVGGQYFFKPELRRALIFGRHDLLQDAPISRLDLLICRNTLMYFTPEGQSAILARFHFALLPTGYLFLGKAEMLLTHTDLFQPIDLKHRVFAKVPKVSLRDRIQLAAQAGAPEDGESLVRHVRLLERANESNLHAQLVIDSAGVVVVANDRARSWFRLGSRDVGRPLQDLEVSYQPVELRSLIDRAYRERRRTGLDRVQRALPGDGVQLLSVQVTPLLDGDTAIGAAITFEDVTALVELQGELERSRQELETAYHELQSTNEELQSTVEELETTNEELQSSNEELETMNEELESTNTELQAINDELRLRGEDMEGINAFMQSVLGSLQLGVVVVDSQLRVKMWYGRSEELWGLRASEVYDKELGELDFGLPVDEIDRMVGAVLADPQNHPNLTLQAVNRRGRGIGVRVVGTVLPGSAGRAPGVVLLMEELPPARS